MSRIKAHTKRDGTSAEVRVPQDHMLAFVGRRDLGSLEKDVYLVILFLCRSFKAEAAEMHEATMDELTAVLGSDARWVRRAVRKLETKGFITVNVGGGRGNPSTYLANPPSLWAPPETGAPQARVSAPKRGAPSIHKGGLPAHERGAPNSSKVGRAKPPFRIAHISNQAIQAANTRARAREDAAGSDEPDQVAVRVVVDRWESLCRRTATAAEVSQAACWLDNFGVKLGADGIADVIENVYRRRQAQGRQLASLHYFDGAVEDAAERPHVTASRSSSAPQVLVRGSLCPGCDAVMAQGATRCWDCGAVRTAQDA